MKFKLLRLNTCPVSKEDREMELNVVIKTSYIRIILI
jgi:hypothetical protein